MASLELTHIEVVSVGAYGDYMKAGQLLKVTKRGERFFEVESFDTRASFKVSAKTKRACGRNGSFIPSHKQPSFNF